MSTPALRPAAPFSAWERAIASRYLRAKRKEGGVALIGAIAFTGIALAVAVLIIVMSVMNGFRSELLGRLLGFQGHAYVGGPITDSPDLGAAVERLRQVPGVTQVAPLVESPTLAGGGAGSAPALVRGIEAADLRNTPLIAKGIRQGSLDGFGAGEYGGDLVLLGERLASSLGVTAGDPVTIGSLTGAATAFGSAPVRKTYTVGGVFSSGVSEIDQATIYMPLPQAQLFFGRETGVDVIELKVADPDHVERVMPALQRAVGSAGIVSDWRQKNSAFWGALQVERVAMRLILMLLVALVFVNIVSALIMLVKNKGRDIAILRTMGAGQGGILRVFFMASASIGVLGTVVGILLGVLFCTFIGEIQQAVEWVTGAQVFNADVYFLNRIPAKIEWLEVVYVAGWSLLLSCLSTLPVAWRASRLDPVEALRYE